MQELSTFYSNEVNKYQTQLSQVKKELLGSSMLRLAVFVLTAFGIYFALGNVKLVLGILLGAIVLFLFLVSRHTDLVYKRDKLLALIKINQQELYVLKGDFYNLPNGDVYKNPEHYFSQDIDLFGRGSFFQYANRTALPQGSDLLANIFTANDVSDIKVKQDAINEIAKQTNWRQEFSAIASLVKTETPYRTIIKWLSNYKVFVPKIMRVLPMVYSIISLVVVAGYFLGYIPGWVSGVLFLGGWLITGRFVKSIGKIALDISKIQTTFQQYQKLILEIEKIEFTTELLKEKRALIIRDKTKTSSILKEFARYLSALDQRNNFIFSIVGNAFLLWDLQQCYKIERWIESYSADVEKWFGCIAFFDAYNSLGNFTFNHPNFTFPEIVESEIQIQSFRAGHPLLRPEKSILNDFRILKEEFFIITGANMAGKSTFLRTVSLHIVMSNIGLPICSNKVKYNPVKLITSMRTSDSLTDDESYFFSELKRLKFIVDEIQMDKYFIVLDEILKGTNSTDKAKGSRKFIEKLIASKSTGIIATHDLSLCETADNLNQVKNYYFDAEIIDNELHFDYKFKKGICQNMNASFLLKKMEIIN